MRKFYSLLVMLLACIMPALAQITSVDQLSNGKIYNLKVDRGYLSYLASSNNLGGIDPATDDSQWAVYHYAGPVIRDGEETEVDGYYLFNISKYSFASTVGNNIVIAPTTEDPAAFNVEYSSGNGFKFECQQNSNWMQLGGSKQYVVTDGNWKTWDAGNKWQITEVGELDANTAARIEKCIKGEDQLLTITLTNQTIDGDAISVTEMLGFAGDVLKISDIANYDYVEAVNEGTSEPVVDRMITVSANEDENVYTVTYQAWPYVYIMGQDENGEGVGSDTEKYVKVGSELEAPAVLGYEVKSVFVNDEPATLPLIVTADMDQASIVFVYAEVQGGIITNLDKLSNTKGYVIACDYTDANSRGVLVYSEHYGKKMLNNADYKDEPTTYANADSTQFALYSDGEGNYYIYNLAAKLFIAKDPSANLMAGQKGASSWTITSWNGESLPWHFQTENDQYTINFQRNSGNSLGATQVHPWGSTTGSADIGNRLYIYEGRDLTAEEIAEIETAIANVVPFSWVAYDPDGTELSSGAKQASAGDTIACPTHVPYSVDFEGSTLEGCHFAVNENGKQTPYIVIDEEAAEATAELQYSAATSLITNKADITNQSAYVIASRDRGPIVWASKPGSGGSRVRNNTDINLTSIDTEECNDTVQWAMYSLDQENFYFVNMAALAQSLEGTWDGGCFGIQEGGKMVLKDMAVAWQIEGWEEEDAHPFHFTTNDGANTLNFQGNPNTGLSWQVTVNSWNTKDPGNQIYLYKGRDLTADEVARIKYIIENTVTVTYAGFDAYGEQLNEGTIIAMPGDTITLPSVAGYYIDHANCTKYDLEWAMEKETPQYYTNKVIVSDQCNAEHGAEIEINYLMKTMTVRKGVDAATGEVLYCDSARFVPGALPTYRGDTISIATVPGYSATAEAYAIGKEIVVALVDDPSDIEAEDSPNVQRFEFAYDKCATVPGTALEENKLYYIECERGVMTAISDTLSSFRATDKNQWAKPYASPLAHNVERPARLEEFEQATSALWLFRSGKLYNVAADGIVCTDTLKRISSSIIEGVAIDSTATNQLFSRVLLRGGQNAAGNFNVNVFEWAAEEGRPEEEKAYGIRFVVPNTNPAVASADTALYINTQLGGNYCVLNGYSTEDYGNRFTFIPARDVTAEEIAKFEACLARTDAGDMPYLAPVGKKGDMNKNGMLDAGDLAMMLDCLVNEVENLDGDMNRNGQLDAGDMGMLVDELVNGGDNVREQVAAVRAQAAGENPFTMDVLDATVGSEENELVFNLTGATAYSTAIFNVTLPEGYTFYFDEDEDDYVITMNIAKPEFTTKLTNNTLRIVAKSGSSKLFKADEGFMKIQIVAAADAKPGYVTISKLQFGKPDGGLLELGDVTGMIRVNGEEPTGISAVAGIKANGAIFDLSGRKVAKLQKGINIVNGNKIVK